jgi:hypothetical protein
MSRGIRQQPDLANIQIRQNLSSQPDLAQNPLMLTAPLFPMQTKPVRHSAAVNFKPFAIVVQVNKSPTPGLSDHLQRTLNHLVAIA